MKAIIHFINKCNYSKRQIHNVSELLDGIVFTQLLDELYHTNNQKEIWNLIINNVQKIRRKLNLQIQEFNDEIYSINNNIFFTTFIQYFMNTLFQSKKEELVYMMKQLPTYSQQEIAQFLSGDIDETNSQIHYINFELSTTNTIISLEESLNNKEQQFQQLLVMKDQMKEEYQNLIEDYQNKLWELEEIIEKSQQKENLFLSSINCQDFDEVSNQIQLFINEIDIYKQKLNEQNQFIEHQQQEINRIKSKNSRMKSQLQSTPTTARTIEVEQIIVKDNSASKTIEILKQSLQQTKEESQKLLELRQSQFESENNRLKILIYQREEEILSLKKKLEKQKIELEENCTIKEPEKKNVFESLKHQGICSSNNSFIIEQQFGPSPKSTIIDMHYFPANPKNKIVQLDKQMFTSCHSRKGSQTKFGQLQLEKQQYNIYNENSTLLENLKYYIQYAQQKDLEIKQLKDMQNENFTKLSQSILKQNTQIYDLNQQINHQNQFNIDEIKQHYENEILSINSENEQMLNDKNELLSLLFSILQQNICNY